MNKLKVIQLLPELNIGGVERGTRDFSEVLAKQGVNSSSAKSILEEYLRTWSSCEVALEIMPHFRYEVIVFFDLIV